MINQNQTDNRDEISLVRQGTFSISQDGFLVNNNQDQVNFFICLNILGQDPDI